jgi:2-methylcitrate dehydratase PrpD
MDCAARLREQHGLRPDAIAEVRCRTAEGPVPRLWEPLAAKRRPTNGYAAKFSLPYLLAVILVHGEAGLARLTDEAVRDEVVLGVAARVGYDIDASIDYPRRFVGHVRIVLTDGRSVEDHQDHPRGGPDFPMSEAELIAKFRGNARLLLPSATTERVVREVVDLASRSQLTTLMELLGGKS